MIGLGVQNPSPERTLWLHFNSWIKRKVTDMTNKELLQQIHRDNREIKRNLQHLANIGLMGVLGNLALEAKKKGDEEGKTLVKAGLFCIVISELLILISEINDYRKAGIKEDWDDLD